MFVLKNRAPRQKAASRMAPGKRAPPRGSQTGDQFTSIQQIFHSEILLIQLFGGHLFDWSNRKLAILYRLFAPPIWMVILKNFYDFGLESKATATVVATIPRSVRRLTEGIQEITNVVLLGSTVTLAVLNIRYHETIKIIINKRLDIDYVQGHRNFEASSIKIIKRLLITWTFLLQPLSHFALGEGLIYVANYIERNSVTDANPDSSDKYVPNELVRILIHALKREIDQLWVVGYFLGPIYMHLMIVATMTDMLKRATLNGQIGTKLSAKQLCVKQVQVTQLLVHVRDVLVVLRRTTGKSYVVGLGLFLALTFTAPSYALADSSAGHHVLTTIFILWALMYLSFVVVSMEITRRLHMAAEEIADKSQLQLVEWSARFYVEHQTRMKLADEITNIWATDWFTPDIRWLLKTCVSLFVLVVGLHQIVEKKLTKE